MFSISALLPHGSMREPDKTAVIAVALGATALVYLALVVAELGPADARGGDDAAARVVGLQQLSQ